MNLDLSLDADVSAEYLGQNLKVVIDLMEESWG